jgi:hypothetical protein
MFESEGVESSILEQYHAWDKHAFKQRYGYFASDLNLRQATIKDGRGKQQKVTLVEAEGHAILQVRTWKRFEKKQVILSPQAHVYAAQTERILDACSSEHKQNLGQQVAAKYVGKKKVSSYDAEEIAEAIERFRKKSSGPTSGTEVLGAQAAENIDESDDSDEEDEDDDGEEPQEEKTAEKEAGKQVPEGQAGDVKQEAPGTVPLLVKRESSASLLGLAEVKVEHATPTKAEGAQTARSRPSPSVTPTASAASSSVLVDAADCLADEGSRVKPASHWLKTLCPTLMLAGQVAQKDIRFARQCVGRLQRRQMDIEAWL